jgi:hypothetical protein
MAKETTVTAPERRNEHRRFRLAGNDNETIVVDELDTEGHRLAGNDNETIVVGTTLDDPDAEDTLAEAPGARRMKR